jgi:hypothetical protein
MALVNGFLQFTGSIKGMSFYTPVGSDKVIMRTKSMLKSLRFKMVRILLYSGSIKFNGRAV